MNFPADDNDVDDILVLYALEHDVALVGQSWIDYFSSVLKACLDGSQSISNPYRIILRDEETLSHWSDERDIIDAITPILNAKAIVMVVSPFYFQNALYRQEFKFIENNIDDLAERLFVVEWTQMAIPQVLVYRNNYRLWTLDKKVKPYTLGLPVSKIFLEEDTEDRKYFWHQIQNLADDIQKIISSSSDTLPTEPSENQVQHTVLNDAALTEFSENQAQHTVFLAEVTDDLYMLREDIKNFLEQQNINVLPENPYRFDDSEALEIAIKEDLKKCNLYVQLFSKVPAYRPDGMATPLNQFNFVQKIFMQSEIEILVWRDFELAPEDSIDSSVDDLYEKTMSLAFKSNIEDFKQQILKQLKQIHEYKDLRKNRPDISGVNFFVHVFGEDEGFADELSDYAMRDFEILCSFSIENLDLEEKLEDIKNNLVLCNIALLIYGKSPITWVRQNILLLNKTISQIEEVERQTIPVPFIIICQVEATGEQLRMKLPPHFELVDFTNKSPRHIIEYILETMESFR